MCSLAQLKVRPVFAAIAGTCILASRLKKMIITTDFHIGYPIASLPMGYLGFNGRQRGIAAIASAHSEAL